ncbi:MAG: GNAT family N-acetyltransferase [Oscillospiraceae bacterium]|nr:GNAT family N-acetyltransferase [Oscillospiraceae bacterium]
MTEIYVIRHVEAEGNLYRMMQGNWDGGVTQLGSMQRDALAERFKNIHIDALYSSPLYRARFTATAITRYHNELEIQIEPRVIEIDSGRWEAQPFGNLIMEEGEQFNNFLRSPEDFKIDGAETFFDVQKRAMEALIEIAERHEGQTVAITSHGVAIRCALTGVLGMRINDVEAVPIFNNTGVARLFYENGKFSAEYLNDYSHLEGLPPSSHSKITALWHKHIDPREHRDFYIECYRQSWLAAHGNLNGFNPETYYATAIEHYMDDPESIYMICNRDEAVGIVELDVKRGEHAGYGWISLLYLREDYRKRGLGIQLLGRAIMKYQIMGRKTLRLHVSDDNAAALAFYKKFGFRMLSTEPGVGSTLLLVERALRSEY